MGVYSINNSGFNGFGQVPIADEDHSDFIDDFSLNLLNYIIQIKPYLKDKIKFNWSVRRIETVGGEKKERGPDISVWSVNPKDGKRDKPLLIIEVIRQNKNSKSYSAGSILDCMKTQPTIKEAFMYDYVKDIWYKYDKGDFIKNSYSDFFETDLKNFVP